MASLSPMDSRANPMDTYTSNAENDDLSPLEKIEGVQSILKTVKTGMLTTRAADGSLHSRAMAPTTPQSDKQLNLIFVANNNSHKFDEIANDSHVNVSFYDPSSTNWASFCGRAMLSRDQDEIQKHWNPTMTAYFGDLHDGMHSGDETDPRVTLIEVIPEEIRYFLTSKGGVRKAISTALNAAKGTVADLGEIRTITKDEILLTQDVTPRRNSVIARRSSVSVGRSGLMGRRSSGSSSVPRA